MIDCTYFIQSQVEWKEDGKEKCLYDCACTLLYLITYYYIRDKICIIGFLSQ